MDCRSKIIGANRAILSEYLERHISSSARKQNYYWRRALPGFNIVLEVGL